MVSQAPGSYLDRLYTELSRKIAVYRLELIKALEKDMPYRSVRLSPAEQVLKFDMMNGESWAQLTSRLYERYRGLPNATQLVNEDLRRYISRMLTLKQQYPDITPERVFAEAFAPRGNLNAP